MVVHHQAGHHHGSSHQDHAHVLDRIGQDGGSGPDQGGQLGSEQIPQHGDQQPAKEGVEKTGGGHGFRLRPFFGSQQPGNAVAGPDAKEKSNGMDDGHGGEGNPHRGGGCCIDLADEIGIRHIVKAGAQHADDGGQGQGSNQGLYRGFQHLFVFFCFFAFCV